MGGSYFILSIPLATVCYILPLELRMFEIWLVEESPRVHTGIGVLAGSRPLNADRAIVRSSHLFSKRSGGDHR